MCKLFHFHEHRTWLDVTNSSELPQEPFGIREEIQLNRFHFVITIGPSVHRQGLALVLLGMLCTLGC